MILLACMFFSIGMVVAQTKTVTGSVTSAEDGLPVVGASVLVKGTTTGTVTDLDGKFILEVSTKAKTLVISYIGMNTQVLPIKSNMKIVLKPDTQMLDDVVVIGYGSGKKIGTVVGSVTTVKAEKINKTPSISALDALQGQVAGLATLTSGGVAGDNNVSMKIHGTGSLGAGSAPLIIIDGIPSSSSAIMRMNPNDIKNISVLKDASATSIYGSRAANGVIYVTTKTGSFNSKARVTVRSQYGWSTLANKKFYKDMMNGQQLRDFWVDMGLYTQEQIKETYANKDGEYYDTKWYNVIQQFDNPQTQNDITVEGGGQKVAYLLGVSQFHQRGSTVGNYFDRLTIRTNVDARPLKWLSTGVTLNMSVDKSEYNSSWGDSGSTSNYTDGGLSFGLNPLFPAYDENGKMLDKFDATGWYNPYLVHKYNPAVNKNYYLLGSAYVRIKPFDGFTITSRVGTDMYFYRYNRTALPSFEPWNGKGWRNKQFSFGYSNTITNTAEYKFTLGDVHHFTILAGQEGVKSMSDYLYSSAGNQVDDRLMNLQNGEKDTYKMKEGRGDVRSVSFFGRLEYNLQDKYFFDASLRRDGNSKFGVDNRYANFWAVGGLWKIKKESFMSDLDWINSLDFKVSYGTQGNAAIGNYRALAKMKETTKYNGETSWYFGSPANPELTWENQKLLTIGTRGRLFDRVDFDIQYYHRATTDMLMSVPYPSTSGFTSMKSNVGELLNHGIDLELAVNILKGKDYFLNFRTTFNYNKSKVKSLFQGRHRWEIAKTGVTYVVGSPVMFYYPLYAGVDPEDGNQMWYLPGEDKDVKTTGETTKHFDESLIQNTGKKRYAPYSGGFSLTGGWRNFTLSADFAYVLGKYLINNDEFFYANPNQFTDSNMNKNVRNYWKPDNRHAKYPDWSNGQTMHFDSHLLQNASFMRLKNLSLAYQLPKQILGYQKLVKSVVFSVTGRNLLTFTKFKGMDPEVASNLTLGRPGNTKQLLFGAEITF